MEINLLISLLALAISVVALIISFKGNGGSSVACIESVTLSKDEHGKTVEHKSVRVAPN